MNKNRFILWLRWTLANGLAELVCLEATYAAFVFISNNYHPSQNMVFQFYAVIAVTSAIIEATTVGLAQAWVMRLVFPGVRLQAWWAATLLGTLLAFALGWWPLNWIMDQLEDTSHYHMYMYEPFFSDPLLWVILLGAATGAVISFAQWLVLRGRVRQAWEWIEGNTLAWAGGFPLILWGLTLSDDLSVIWQVRLVTAEALLVVGLVVGAINGYYLLRLAGKPAASRFVRSFQAN